MNELEQLKQYCKEDDVIHLQEILKVFAIHQYFYEQKKDKR